MAFSRLQPWLRPWAKGLFDVATRFRMQPRVVSTFRSNAEQRLLFEKFQRGESMFPAAPPGRSKHNIGEAFDLVVNSPQNQSWLGAVWESWGGRWGGRFGDPNHFDAG